MTYTEFLKAMNEDKVVCTFKGKRTMLTVEKLNDCEAVVKIVFFKEDKEGEQQKINRKQRRIQSVMIWEEAWDVYDAFKSND